ncbi:MAG: hypothetical protein CMJ83_19025 [Planctomycetes bacterium]|jgi:diguanylate cyclase (GGDEF)-like protein|nr:hypothetical protein [Planctomycetota bacterium]
MARDHLTILAVDDDAGDLNLLRRYVAEINEWDIEFIAAESAEAALLEASRRRVDLVFLDYYLGEGSGLDLLARLIGSPDATCHAVVMITGQGDEDLAAAAIKAGACDYIPKRRLDAEGLQRAIRSALETSRLRLQLEEQQRELERLAREDDLTGLLNRRALLEFVERETLRSRRYGSPLCLMMLDLDEFKVVNDTCGHATGDAVLRETAGLIREWTRATDVPGRIGGDEFCILMVESRLEGAIVYGERLCGEIAGRSFLDGVGKPIAVTCSIGIAELSEEAVEAGDLIDRADQALYHAKSAGRNCVRGWRRKEG